MTAEEPTTAGPPRLLALLLGGAAAVVLLVGVQSLAWLIGPLALALVVVITVRPVETWLRGRGLPGPLAVLTLVVLVYAVVLVLAGVVVVSVARLATVLPRYRDQAAALVGDLTGVLAANGVGLVPLRELAASLDLGRVVGLAAGVLSGLVGITGSAVFLFSLLLFLSIESGGFRAKLEVLAHVRPAVGTALADFVRGTRRFLVVTTVFGLLTALVDTAALLLLGVPLAVLWGLLAFITNYIPYVGFFVGVVPPALLALLEGGWSLATVVVVVYVVVNFVLCSLVQPRFIGDAVGLSLTVVFLSLGFWAWLLGPLGAVLAVPLTLLVKTLLLDADPRTAWLSALVEARPGVVLPPTPPGPRGPSADEGGPGSAADGTDRVREDA